MGVMLICSAKFCRFLCVCFVVFVLFAFQRQTHDFDGAVFMRNKRETTSLSHQNLSGTTPASEVTIAIQTRAYKAELPHLRSWIGYHVEVVNIQMICIRVTRLDDLSQVRNLAKYYNASGKIAVAFTDNDLFKRRFNRLDSFCEAASHVAYIDHDEYIVVPSNKSLVDVVLAEAAAVNFRLVWWEAPYDGLNTSFRPRWTHGSNRLGKYLARLDGVTELGPHSVWCGKARCQIAKQQLTLVHFSYRGLYDALMKDVSSDLKRSEWRKSDGKGGRLKHLALLRLCGERAQRTHRPMRIPNVTCHVDRDRERALLMGQHLKGEIASKNPDALISVGLWYGEYVQALRMRKDVLFCHFNAVCDRWTPAAQARLLKNVGLNDIAFVNATCIDQKMRVRL
eukprot:TRINITY_DN7296_c0_g1_i3.p1 TRINITY_DN7296_c0_g1~~TRINITY_DN7296_c0_g1_i3.p1  ORF type:complete len:395 (+),score=28.76 TRINITY_DN7296_c0_g1_i3:47-1231(+)